MVTPEEIEQLEAFDAQGARVLSRTRWRPPVDSRPDAVSGLGTAKTRAEPPMFRSRERELNPRPTDCEAPR